MAKKVVATLKREASEQEKVVKVIRAKRSEKTGAYTFKEEFVRADKVKDYFLRSKTFFLNNILKISRKGFPTRKAFFVRYGIF